MTEEIYQTILRCLPFFIGELFFILGDILHYYSVKTSGSLDDFRTRIKQFLIIDIVTIIAGTGFLIYGVTLTTDFVAVATLTIMVTLQFIVCHITKKRESGIKLTLAIREIVEYMTKAATAEIKNGSENAAAFLKLIEGATMEQIIMWLGEMLPEDIDKDFCTTKEEFLTKLKDKAFTTESINSLTKQRIFVGLSCEKTI